MPRAEEPIVYSDDSDDEAPEEIGKASSKESAIEMQQKLMAAAPRRQKRKRRRARREEADDELPAEFLAGVVEAEKADAQKAATGSRDADDAAKDTGAERLRQKKKRRLERAKRRAHGDGVLVEKEGFRLVVATKRGRSRAPDTVAACESATGVSAEVLAFQKRHFFGDRLKRGRGRRARAKFGRR
jgi:hypothetical protein